MLGKAFTKGGFPTVQVPHSCVFDNTRKRRSCAPLARACTTSLLYCSRRSPVPCVIHRGLDSVFSLFCCGRCLLRVVANLAQTAEMGITRDCVALVTCRCGCFPAHSTFVPCITHLTPEVLSSLTRTAGDQAALLARVYTFCDSAGQIDIRAAYVALRRITRVAAETAL